MKSIDSKQSILYIRYDTFYSNNRTNTQQYQFFPNIIAYIHVKYLVLNVIF